MITHAQANEFNFKNYLDSKLKNMSVADKTQVRTVSIGELKGVHYYLVAMGQKVTSFFVGIKENKVVFESKPLLGEVGAQKLGDDYILYCINFKDNLYYMGALDPSTLDNIIISKNEPFIDTNIIYNQQDKLFYFLSEKDGDKAGLYYFNFKDKKIKKGPFDKPHSISVIASINDKTYLRYNDGFNDRTVVYDGIFQKILEDKVDSYVNDNQQNFKLTIDSNIEVPVKHSMGKNPSNLLFVVFSKINLVYGLMLNPFTDHIGVIGDRLGYETLNVYQPGYRDLGRKYHNLPFGDFKRYQNYLSSILEKIHKKFPNKKIIAVGDNYTANALIHVAIKHPELMNGLILHNVISEWKSYILSLNKDMIFYRRNLVKFLGKNPELSDEFNNQISILGKIKNLPSSLPILIYYVFHPQLPWTQQAFQLNEEISKEKKTAILKENKEYYNSTKLEEDIQRSLQNLGNYINEYLQTFKFSQELSKTNESQQINEPLNLPSNQTSSQEAHTISEISGMSPISGMNSIIGSDFQEIRDSINNKKFTPEAQKKALKEFERLKMMQPFAPEAAEIRKYLDWLLSFPWVAEKNQKQIDLKEAEKILNEDHYGLMEVKEHVLEYLAAQQRAGHKKVPVLCLLGSPGVGKTSLAKSIARALGREFQRISLGGIRDEAEIRGHMRSYVSARPGRVIEALKKAKTTNVLILLDEIDKIGGMNWSGDPSAALLELLDPEQNSDFLDHYMEIGADLSSVMFVATANDLSNFPKAVLDRMEIVTIDGYTLQEKIEITKRHIIPHQMKMNGLNKKEISIDDEVIPLLIEHYTFEAGVRGLERIIAKIFRKVAKELTLKGNSPIRITKNNLEKYAGREKVHRTRAYKINQVGVATGLAASGAGGNLGFIEAVIMPGTGKIVTTGTLGNMTVESFNAAASYIHAHAKDFGINPEVIKEKNIHLHMPEAGMAKDGPSAGVAAAVSIVSVFTNIPVLHNVAMTGEITLHGNVLRIGGLKEKLLAAQREGIKKVLIPADNIPDLDMVPESCKSALEIIPIKKVEEAFAIALEQNLNSKRK